MATWKIPVTWEVFGIVEIEAESLDEAIKKFDEKKIKLNYLLILNIQMLLLKEKMKKLLDYITHNKNCKKR